MRLVYIFLLLFILILHPIPAHTRHQKRYRSIYNNHVRRCQQHCQELTDPNCVNNCISQTCYNSVYANDPLEMGEIDPFRQKKFDDCAFQETNKIGAFSSSIQNL